MVVSEVRAKLMFHEISVTQPKARQEYRCDWCADAVTKGEKHYSQVYKIIDGISNARYHNECWNAMNNSDADHLMDGWMPGDMERGEILK